MYQNQPKNLQTVTEVTATAIVNICSYLFEWIYNFGRRSNNFQSSLIRQLQMSLNIIIYVKPNLKWNDGTASWDNDQD